MKKKVNRVSVSFYAFLFRSKRGKLYMFVFVGETLHIVDV